MTAGAPVTVLIADDEAPARGRLRQLLGELPGHTIVGEAGDGEAALRLCAETRPDVVLLDIRMPGMDGLEVAGHLARWEQRPAVIFTTAYDEYAIDAFDAQAIGYLLKPVRRERLQQSLARASRLSPRQLGQVRGPAPREQLCIQSARSLQLIPVGDISCFQADQKYVTVHHRGGQALLDEPLKDLEAEFGERFLRIHRNALVAVAAVEALERLEDGSWQVRLNDGDRVLPVSRRHLAEVKRRLRGA